MADLEPTKDVLDNLDILMNFEILENEKDWLLIQSMDHMEKNDANDSKSGDEKDGK